LGFAGGPARLLLVSILDSLRPARGLRVLVAAGGRGVGAATARAFHLAGSGHLALLDVSPLALLFRSDRLCGRGIECHRTRRGRVHGCH
jgi:NAD(P)-dependent dehydrogenase (short-subunit alcohol dehydrogenase family)